MELVIVISTITSFFSHFMIERALLANSISVVLATLITWALVGDGLMTMDALYMRRLFYTIVIAFAVSIVVGLVFSYHKKCS
jgi:hypothetical protein